MTEGKLKQYVAAFAASWTLTGVGTNFCFSSLAIPQLIRGDGGILLTEDEASWFASIYAIGNLTGSLVGAYQADKLGRKKSLIIDCATFILSSLLISFANGLPMLIVGRLCGGHASGSAFVAVPIYIGETSHPSIRGTTGSFITICYSLGFTFTLLLGCLLPWRLVILACVGNAVLAAFILLFCKESPTWLIRNGYEEDGLQSLLNYRGNNMDVSRKEFERIRENLTEELKTDNLTLKEKIKDNVKKLTRQEFLKPFVLVCLLLNIGLDLSGFPSLAFYMHTIIEKSTLTWDPYVIAVGVSAVRLASLLLSPFLLGRFRRKLIYLISACVVLFALLIEASYESFSFYLPLMVRQQTSWTPLLGVILMYFGFGLGYGPLVWIMQGELLPANTRSIGCGLIGVVETFFLFVAIKMVPLLLNTLGTGGMFFLYFGICLSNFLVCYYMMPETKDMSLEDIEDYYRGGGKKTLKDKDKMETFSVEA